MSGRMKLWLLTVVGLTLVAFFYTFRPITLRERKNPTNPRLTVPPAAGPIAGKLYVYPPVPTLNLDLDLQGGMRVILKVQHTAQFEYLFPKKFAKDDKEALKVKQGLLGALPATDAGLGRDRTIEIPAPQYDKVLITTVITAPADKAEAEMERQDRQIQKVLREKIGPDFDPEKSLTKPTSELLGQVVGIVERRVNPGGLKEARVRKQTPDKIVVEIPGEDDPEAALELIQKTAVLKFQHIPTDIQVTFTEGGKPKFSRGGEDLTTKEVLDLAPVIMTGSELEPKCRVGSGAGGETVVEFSWRPEAADKFRAFTAGHINQHLAIVLDGEIISAPVIRSAIGRRGQIEGDFSIGEAAELKSLLNAGALPVPLTVEENRVVSATLGADSINHSLWAGLIGLVAVLIFMAAYYRFPGLLADLALIIYGLLVLFVLRLFNATLTLPGIAGIIISLGMAVDANVIIFERLKEELRTGKTLKSAIEAGFNRAWTAILDSNVCSFLTGFVLWGLGTPAIKGFAIALIIGVAVSMFTAITITRLFIDISANTRAAERPAWFGV